MAETPLNTVRVKTRGRNKTKVYQRWDGKQWLTATGSDVNKYKSLYNNQQLAGKRPESNTVPKPPAAAPKSVEFVKPVPTKRAPEKLPKDLRYPYESIESGQDFIKFSIYTYKRGGLVTRDSGQNNPLQGDLLGAITLPVPSQVSDSNSASYGSGNLNFLQERGLGMAGSAIQGDIEGIQSDFQGMVGDLAGNGELVKSYFAMQAVNSFGGNLSLDQLLARSNGAVINPNMELLFKGPSLRQFKFQFKFTPRFKTESTEVRDIIKAFKRNMAPKGSGGATLKTPNIFQIQYLTGTGDHEFLHKFKLCALTNMSVNYTADGVHATYTDGTPVSMMMDLSFQELTPIYNEDYDDYGSDTGVGY